MTQTSNDDAPLRMDDVVRQVDDVTGALEDLSQVLDQNEELEIVLHRCCRQATTAIPGADYAGVTLLRDGAPYTAATNDDRVHDLDRAQHANDAGPSITAARTGKIVRARIADSEAQWPDFTRTAAKLGIGSVLSAPLYLDEDYQGALNLYGHGDEGYRELEAALLELYTTAAEAALRAELRYRTARGHTEQLRGALGSRAVIDQAKGIIMAIRQVDADTAFNALVVQSQQQNRKLREVAERFVTGIVTPGASPSLDGAAPSLDGTGFGHTGAVTDGVDKERGA